MRQPSSRWNRASALSAATARSARCTPSIIPKKPRSRLAKSKNATLLAQAGYPDGLKLDLHTTDTGNRRDLAVVLKEQWAEAGIDVNVIIEPESVYFADNGWLQVDLGITNWGCAPYPQFTWIR